MVLCKRCVSRPTPCEGNLYVLFKSTHLSHACHSKDRVRTCVHDSIGIQLANVTWHGANEEVTYSTVSQCAFPASSAVE